jgi:hypothetical protein
MAIWRTLVGAALVLIATPGAGAQTYPLIEAPKAGDCYRLRLDMALTGQMRVTRGEATVPLPLVAAAVHEFPERILALDSDGVPQKSARVYEKARAEVTVAGGRSVRELRSDRQLIAALRHHDVTQVFCPVGPLTREELQLTSEHLNTLALTGLLPGKPVAIGDTWKVANPVVQALCLFEGMTAQDLTCKLDTVTGNLATVSVSGSATGIDLGALVKVNIQAAYRFDLGQNRLVSLTWKQKDEREAGPVSPAMTVEATTTVTRTAVTVPAALSDVALVKVPDGVEPPPAPMTHLAYRDPKSRFDLHYGREWQIVGQTEQHLVMRLMDRGDFVAQVTVTPWASAKPGEHLAADEFRRAMAETPGWEPAEELLASEVPLEGAWCYRISAVGQLDGLRVTQNFYLIASPAGEQVVVAFTMNPSQAEQLGTRDLSFIGGLGFPASRKNK